MGRKPFPFPFFLFFKPPSSATTYPEGSTPKWWLLGGLRVLPPFFSFFPENRLWVGANLWQWCLQRGAVLFSPPALIYFLAKRNTCRRWRNLKIKLFSLSFSPSFSLLSFSYLLPWKPGTTRCFREEKWRVASPFSFFFFFSFLFFFSLWCIEGREVKKGLQKNWLFSPFFLLFLCYRPLEWL